MQPSRQPRQDLEWELLYLPRRGGARSRSPLTAEQARARAAKEKECVRGDSVVSAILVSQVAGMTLEETGSTEVHAALLAPVGRRCATAGRASHEKVFLMPEEARARKAPDTGADHPQRGGMRGGGRIGSIDLGGEERAVSVRWVSAGDTSARWVPA